jgi:hypothetical protein
MTTEGIILAVCGGALTVCGALIVAIVSDIRDQIKSLHTTTQHHGTRLAIIETRCGLECAK